VPTIGVALAIPEPWAQDLQDYRASIGDTTASQIPTHVTLVPPVAVDAQALPGIERHLEVAATEVEGFRMRLRGTGTFRPVSPVVFVAVAEGISQCEALAEGVRRGPLDVALMFPYHPHVTVAHHLDDVVLDKAFEDLAGFECVFDVDGFHLYTHHPDLGWQATRDFPLD
jgi:2'-5' RNA ligase